MEREIRIEENISLGENGGSAVQPKLSLVNQAAIRYLRSHPSADIPTACADVSSAYLCLEEDIINQREPTVSLCKLLVLEACLMRQFRAQGVDWEMVENGLKKYVESGFFA